MAYLKDFDPKLIMSDFGKAKMPKTGGIFDKATQARLEALKTRKAGGATGGIDAGRDFMQIGLGPVDPSKIRYAVPPTRNWASEDPAQQAQMLSTQQTAAAPTAGTPQGYTFQPTDYEKLYGNIGNARKQALDAALLNQQQQIYAQGNMLKGQYDALRGQTYTNARVTALGNNERLAATGLAGGANAGPQTGYSETSRIAQDTALGNSLNALTQQEQGARNDLMTAENTARLGRDQQVGATMADLEAQKMNAISQQNQFQAGYEQSNAQFAAQQAAQQAALDEQIRQHNDTTALSQKQFEEQKAQAAQAAAMQKALQEVQTFGRVMTKETAKLLGVKVGTRINK